MLSLARCYLFWNNRAHVSHLCHADKSSKWYCDGIFDLNIGKERTILLDVELDRPNLYFNSLPLGIGVRFRAKRGTAATQCRTPLDHLVNTLVDKVHYSIPKTIIYFDSIATLKGGTPSCSLPWTFEEQITYIDPALLCWPFKECQAADIRSIPPRRVPYCPSY